MTSYSDIKAILDAAIGGDDIGAHGAFWRERSRDQFVRHRVFGQALLFASGSGFDPDNSALIKALEGRAPFGRDVGTPGANFNRMPSRRAPLAPEEIEVIRQWIRDGCPE
jgi:hypothetical protein